jgi:hypothetical protein
MRVSFVHVSKQITITIQTNNHLNLIKLLIMVTVLKQAEFEDTKGAIIIRISKKNRQHSGQKKKYKRTNNDQQNIHIKLKIE